MASGRRIRIAMCLLAFVISAAHAQPSSTPPVFEPLDDIPEFISFFGAILFPKVIQDVYLLKAYIRGESFKEFRRLYGDVYAVDAIFRRALQLSWNNAYEALLISLFATMDHRRFGVRFPILGPLIWVPLTSEFADEFGARIRALPSRLYPDSPPGSGDRDKLQHFFGSAFIAYMFESRQTAAQIGEFIEWGEQMFIVDGALDERDFRANVQGQEFGMQLLRDKEARPSSFFTFAIAEQPARLGCLPGVFFDQPDVGMEIR